MVHRSAPAALVLLLGVVGCGESASADRSTTDLGVAPPTLASPPVAASSQPGTAPAPPAGDRPSPRQTLEDLGHVKGSPDAPVRIIEFSDFGCGYCRKFHEETFPQILDEFVNAGTVQWRTVQFDVGMFPNAEDAALAGECAAEQERFDPMADGLFAEQRTWKGGSDAAGVFESVARDAGLDMARFRSCMTERRPQEQVAVATQLARQLGIRGTPTFFIEGFPVQGALPFELWKEYIGVVLAEKEKQQAGAG